MTAMQRLSLSLSTSYTEKMIDTETDGKRDVTANKRKWLLTFLGF